MANPCKHIVGIINYNVLYFVFCCGQVAPGPPLCFNIDAFVCLSARAERQANHIFAKKIYMCRSVERCSKKCSYIKPSEKLVNLDPTNRIYIYVYIGVRGFPARGYFIPGRDGGGAGGREKFRVVVAVVVRPGPGLARPPFLFLPRFSNTFEMFDFGILVRFS